MASTPELVLEETPRPVLDMELPSDSMPASLDHGNPISLSISPHPMVPLTTAAILSQRRRRKSSVSLKRSASTPNVRGHHSGDAGLSLAEKRRNKLGYHRTSVACGHCRRRKIRCLAAPDDPQGRCANCIRLKKECNFFPVDQQPPIERRPRAASSVNGMNSSSSDSSAATHGSHMFTQVEPFSTYPGLPISTHDYPPASQQAMSVGLVSPLTRVPESLRTFDFPQQQRTSWGSPFPEQGPVSAGYSSPGDPPPHTLWGRHSDSPVTPGFSPHMSGPTSSMHNSFSDSRSSLTSFAPSRNDSAWSMPARSMSFGVLEGLPMNNNTYDHNNTNFYPHPLPKDVRRRASEMMRPPSLQTSSCSSSTSISESHNMPHSAPAQNSPVNHWQGLPTAYSAFPSTSMSKSPYDGSWYSDAPPLAKVQEEEISPHFGGEPAILYAGDHN